MSYFWQSSVLLMFGFSSTVSLTRCPSSLQGSWAKWPLKVPSNSNNSMVQALAVLSQYIEACNMPSIFFLCFFPGTLESLLHQAAPSNNYWSQQHVILWSQMERVSPKTMASPWLAQKASEFHFWDCHWVQWRLMLQYIRCKTTVQTNAVVSSVTTTALLNVQCTSLVIHRNGFI